MNCMACKGPFHPATGHQFTPGPGVSPMAVLCGPCARGFVTWVKGHVCRRWSKGDFYKAAAESKGCIPPR